jgi:hypothetical protein
MMDTVDSQILRGGPPQKSLIPLYFAKISVLTYGFARNFRMKSVPTRHRVFQLFADRGRYNGFECVPECFGVSLLCFSPLEFQSTSGSRVRHRQQVPYDVLLPQGTRDRVEAPGSNGLDRSQISVRRCSGKLESPIGIP